MADNMWQVPTPFLPLTENEVHVWRAPLDISTQSMLRFQRLLLPEEYAKAQRFYFEKDRHHWTVARGILRTLLGLYMQQEPGEITFQLNAYGKPSLAPVTHQPPLQFNLSHSKDVALYAFAYKRHIGVDVEYMSSNISYTELAQHSFSPAEQAELDTVPLHEKQLAFFKCWTSKEAYIKARGLGLSLPLHLFDVSLLPHEPVALLASREDVREAQRWTMYKLEPGENYAGALAVEGPELSIRCWQWTDS